MMPWIFMRCLSFSTCPKLTSADRVSSMRANRVVPMRQNGTPLKSDGGLLFCRNLRATVVIASIQASATMEAGVRSRGADVLQHHLVTHQWFTRPVRADQAKHAVIDRIPLRRSGRKMRHGDRQIELIREFLQCQLPFPLAVVVGTAAVGLDQQAMLVGITRLPNFHPPVTNSGYLRMRRLVRRANHHVAIVVSQIIDADRYGPPDGPRREVVVQHLPWPTPPALAKILEVAYPLFFLGIYANYRPFSPQIPVPQPGQITELPIPIAMSNSCLLLATSLQRKMQTPQQSRERGRRQPHPTTTQGLAKFPQRAVGPFQAGDRIPGRGSLQKLLQGRQSPGRFSSKRLRPAPDWRARPPGSRRFGRIPRSPSPTEFRCKPVIRATSKIPPRPIFHASKPAINLRMRSSPAARSRLIPRWMRTIAPRGLC